MQVSTIHNKLQGIEFIAKYSLFTVEYALFPKAIKLEGPLNEVTVLEQFYPTELDIKFILLHTIQ